MQGNQPTVMLVFWRQCHTLKRINTWQQCLATESKLRFSVGCKHLYLHAATMEVSFGFHLLTKSFQNQFGRCSSLSQSYQIPPKYAQPIGCSTGRPVQRMILILLAVWSLWHHFFYHQIAETMFAFSNLPLQLNHWSWPHSGPEDAYSPSRRSELLQRAIG